MVRMVRMVWMVWMVGMADATHQSKRKVPHSRGSTPACEGRSLMSEVALLLQ